MQIEPKIERELRELRSQLEKDGQLLPKETLNQYYSTFRQKFGPEVLAQIDGEELLEIMHTHGNKDSLVYWLEFKDDEELPAKFGSIAGGSAGCGRLRLGA